MPALLLFLVSNSPCPLFPAKSFTRHTIFNGGLSRLSSKERKETCCYFLTHFFICTTFLYHFTLPPPPTPRPPSLPPSHTKSS